MQVKNETKIFKLFFELKNFFLHDGLKKYDFCLLF